MNAFVRSIYPWIIKCFNLYLFWEKLCIKIIQINMHCISVNLCNENISKILIFWGPPWKPPNMSGVTSEVCLQLDEIVCWVKFNSSSIFFLISAIILIGKHCCSIFLVLFYKFSHKFYTQHSYSDMTLTFPFLCVIYLHITPFKLKFYLKHPFFASFSRDSHLLQYLIMFALHVLAQDIVPHT